MSKKSSLPESLDLLLDTMCNTFGGIMFIAISLIVMSQLAAKQMKDMTSEQFSEHAMKQLEQRILEEEQNINLLHAKIAHQKFHTHLASPEKKKLIQQYLTVCQKVISLKSELEQTAVKIAAAQEKLKRIQRFEQLTMEKLKRVKEKNEQDKQKNKILQSHLENEIRKLQEELKNTQPKTLRFGVDLATDLSPYFVLIYDSRIYRAGDQRSPNSDEVKWNVLLGGKALQMIPIRGNRLSNTPEIELNYLFRQINPSRFFIFLSTDIDSYSTLLVVRQYLRNRGYQVFLDVNPKFVYSIGNADYKASK